MNNHTSIIDRLKTGKGIAIFGFDENSEESKTFLEEIKSVDGLVHFEIPEYISKYNDEGTIHGLLERVENSFRLIQNHQPVLISVKPPLDKLENAKVDIFGDGPKVEQLCLADLLFSISKTDVLVINNAGNNFSCFSDSEIPLTPIEKLLFDEMKKANLHFEIQKKIGKYTVDFLVNKSELSIVVEADGAEFHDKDKDTKRDNEIRETFKLDTLRFSGSRIYHDSEGCIQEILNKFDKLSKEKKFEYEDFQQLDKSQKKPVQHKHGHVRVLAPAGSGKTKVLVNRISHLLNSGVQPGSIITIAFNRKAFQQLQDRLNHLNIPVSTSLTDKSGVTVRTFNALGYQLLLMNGFEFNLMTSTNKFKEFVRKALLKHNIRLPQLRGIDNLDLVIRRLARITRGLESPNLEPIEIHNSNNNTSEEPFPPFYTAIRDSQEEQRVITFDDQIFNALKLVVSEPIFRHEIQRRFRHILIDEYQDLNKAQISLVRMIANGGARIFAVGDDDQLIYSWRNARTQHLLVDFGNFFPKSETYTLEINYRCAKRIVEPTQRLISYNSNRFKKNIFPSPNAPGGTVLVKGSESVTEQSKVMIDFIKRYHKTDYCDWNDMAVLTRFKIQLFEVKRALDTENIPSSSLPKIKLYSTSIGLILLAYLRIIYANKNSSGQDLSKVMNHPNRYMSREFCENLSKSESPFIYIDDYISKEFVGGNEYRADQIKQLLTEIEDQNSLMKGRSVYEILKNTVSCFRLDTLKIGNDFIDLDEADDETIIEIILEESRNYENIEKFIGYLEDRVRFETEEEFHENNKELNNNESSKKEVQLNTIHSTKGKEWKLVVIFDANEKTIQGRSSKKTESEIEEERRVFYVGMTRAINYLAITSRENNPISFLKEAFFDAETINASKGHLSVMREKKEKELYTIKNDSLEIANRIDEHEIKISDIKSGKYLEEMQKVFQKHSDDKIKYEEEIYKWENTRPDGLIRRIFKDGFSRKDIDSKIIKIQNNINNLLILLDKMDRKINSKTHQKQLIEKITLEKNNLQKTYDHSLVEANDVENILEIFRMSSLSSR